MAKIKRITALSVVFVLVSCLMPFTALALDGDYSVTVRGSRASASASGAGRYDAGDTVYIDAGSRDSYFFDGWSVTGGRRVTFDNRNHESTSFIMPNGNVTVTANWYSKHDYFNGNDDGYEIGERSSIGTMNPPAGLTVTRDTAMTALNKAVSGAVASGKSNATIKFQNAGNISSYTLKAITSSPVRSGINLNIQADTFSSLPGSRNSVDVRMTFKPDKFTKGLNLSASATNSRAAKIKARYTDTYKNGIMVIAFEQQEKFSWPVKIAAKKDPGLKKSNLVFYTYNSEADIHKRISQADYRIDNNGYVHFTTQHAGVIIISNGALTKR